MKKSKFFGKKKIRFISSLAAVLTVVGMLSVACLTVGASSYGETGKAVTREELASLGMTSDSQDDNQTGAPPSPVGPSSDLNVFEISDKNIEIGKYLTAQITTNSDNVTWSSSNKKIATVDKNGVVKGLKVGSCVITATDDKGNSASCKVQVKKVCYLTIDDSPNARTNEMLDMLKKHNVKATFFITYHSKYLYYTRDMQAQGHLVGLHTYTHDYKVCYKTPYAYYEGLEKLEAAVQKYTGTKPYIIRFPGGSNNRASNSLTMKRIIVGANDLGYRAFDWTASTNDATTGAGTSQSINTVKKTCTQDVEIILMHDKSFNLKAMETFLPYLKNKGYIFETLDNCPNQYTFNPVYTKTVKSTKVTVSKSTANVYEGKTLTLTAKMTPSDSTDFVRWESSDTSIATVNVSGKVKGVKQGTAVITAITSSGKKAVCKVNVKIPAKKVTLSHTSHKFYVGDSIKLNAEISPENSQDTVKWTTSSSKIAKVDSKGNVVAKAKGQATITAQTESGVKATCVVTVVQPTKTFKINKKSASVYVGNTVTLSVTLSKGSNDPVSWKSSDKNIAKVNSKGEVTAVSAGTATVTATTFSGKTVSCKVTVRTKAKSVQLDRTSITAKKGDVIVLNAEITSPKGCNDTLTWTTSSKDKAKIQKTENNSAEIRIVGKGSVVIKVKTGSGKYAQCKITCK